MRDGFRLELPTGAVFEARQNVVTTTDHNYQFIFNGGREALAVYDQTSQPSTANGQTQAAFVGSGAGVRQIVIEFQQGVDYPGDWGGLNRDAHARSKRDALDNALATTPIDSTDPATVEFGEYSSTGEYAPLSVVVSEVNLPYDPDDRLGVGAFEGRLTLLDAADLAEVETATGLTG